MKRALACFVLLSCAGLAANATAQPGGACESRYCGCLDACLHALAQCQAACQPQLKACLDQAALSDKSIAPAQRAQWVEGRTRDIIARGNAKAQAQRKDAQARKADEEKIGQPKAQAPKAEQPKTAASPPPVAKPVEPAAKAKR